METIPIKETKKHPEGKNPSCRYRINILIAGLIFIAIGVLILLRNLGAIEPELYRVLFSWQMLLIVLGVWGMCLRNTIGGVILVGVGTFFMIPLLAPVGSDWTATYWPFIFILLGIIVLVRLFLPSRSRNVHRHSHKSCQAIPESKDGFIEVDNSFGSMRHIVLDPVFRGARIRTTCSGTILDLKRTTLAEGETYIDVEMTLSGLELHVPENWTVVVEQLSVMLGGVDEKRYYSTAVDSSRKLILRGNLTLSGIEIDN